MLHNMYNIALILPLKGSLSIPSRKVIKSKVDYSPNTTILVTFDLIIVQENSTLGMKMRGWFYWKGGYIRDFTVIETAISPSTTTIDISLGPWCTRQSQKSCCRN